MNNHIWLIIALTGTGTYLLRLSFIQLLSGQTLSPAIRRVLRYIPSAVLAALVLPAFVMPDGVVDISLGNIHLIAGLLALAAAFATRNMLVVLGVGMGSLWGLNYFAQLVTGT